MTEEFNNKVDELESLGFKKIDDSTDEYFTQKKLQKQHIVVWVALNKETAEVNYDLELNQDYGIVSLEKIIKLDKILNDE